MPARCGWSLEANVGLPALRQSRGAGIVRKGKGARLLTWALIFLVVAIIAGFLGFGGVASAATGIAKILFFVFLIVFLVMTVTSLVG